jgi:precorrin-2 dehydrogenase / sirohydrochlorin ferrochelatase
VFYPLFMDLRDRQVLVVGGGPVAERKVDSLVEAGAAVTVVAPSVTPRLQQHAEAGSIRAFKREFAPSDLDNALLVISATDVPAIQEEVAAAARARAILINTVDHPRLCDFIVPAVVRRGDVILAISTSGTSPALAAALRAKLDGLITNDTARAARILGEVRSEVHARFADPSERRKVFEGIVESGILDWISECDDDAALKRVREILEGFR